MLYLSHALKPRGLSDGDQDQLPPSRIRLEFCVCFVLVFYQVQPWQRIITTQTRIHWEQPSNHGDYQQRLRRMASWTRSIRSVTWIHSHLGIEFQLIIDLPQETSWVLWELSMELMEGLTDSTWFRSTKTKFVSLLLQQHRPELHQPQCLDRLLYIWRRLQRWVGDCWRERQTRLCSRRWSPLVDFAKRLLIDVQRLVLLWSWPWLSRSTQGNRTT